MSIQNIINAHMPFRTKVLYISVGKKLPTYTVTTTVGEQISITGTTHVYYPQIAEYNVGFNSTAFGDRIPDTPFPTDENMIPSAEPVYNPLDETVVGGYGFDYISQPANTTIDSGTGASISITEVNGLLVDTAITPISISINM